jgi:hypothetical protein
MSSSIGGDYSPDDVCYLESVQERYGSTFEGISTREKLFLVSTLASHLCILEAGETRNEIYKLSVQLQIQLEQSDQRGLLEALIAQIRWGLDEQQESKTLY